MKKQRETIYKILKVCDATNKTSWWNIADEICERQNEALAKARENGWQTGYKQCKEDKEGLK